MMTETLISVLWIVVLVLGFALAIAWLFLPWFLLGKMDRVIELLEKIAAEKPEVVVKSR